MLQSNFIRNNQSLQAALYARVSSDQQAAAGTIQSQIATIEQRSDPVMPDGKPAAAPWHLMTYEFHMKPGEGAAPCPAASPNS